MHWLLICALVASGNGDYGEYSKGTEAGAILQNEPESASFQEAEDFVVGLTNLNNQILDILKQQPTQNVIIIPFTDFEGKNSRVSAYLTEQVVTAIAASRELHIQDNSELVAMIEREGISPMLLAANTTFRQASPRFDNTNIIVGTITDLQKKVALMARVIQGKTSNYAGAAIVYLRIGEEIDSLLAADRTDAMNANNTTASKNNTDKSTSEQPGNHDTSTSAQNTAGKRVENTTQQKQKPSNTTPALTGTESEQTIYNQGRQYYESGNYDQAVALFNALLKKYPESPLADNAYYWIGETFYQRKNWAKAWDYFQKVLNEYPYGNKVPAAMLKRGYAEEQLGRLDNAIATMEEIIRLFDDFPEANLARRKLQLLRARRQ